MIEAVLAYISEFIQNYINITYIIAVIFVTEFIKRYIPKLLPNYRKFLTLAVAFFLMLVFISWELFLGNKEQIVPYLQRILMSFPGITTFYSYFAGPLLKRIDKNAE